MNETRKWIFHRISAILEAAGYHEEAKDVIKKWNHTKEELHATG